MSCSVTLKPTREKGKVDHTINSKVVLRSEDGDEVAYLSKYFFYFNNNDELMYYDALAHDRKPDSGGWYINPIPIGKNVFGVFTNYEGERALIIVGEYHSKEDGIIKEGYILSPNIFRSIKNEIIPAIEEEKSFYIKPAGSGVNGKKEAIMYDLKGNELQNFSKTAFFYKGDTGSIICDISISGSSQCFEDSKFYAVGEKIGDKYNIRIEDNDSLGYKDMMLSLNNDAFMRMKTKIDLCTQKEALCKELDESSMMMSEQHHPCISELGKADPIIDTTTYGIDTYM